MKHDDYYNTINFSILVAHHGNWDIYRNERGDCAAIAVKDDCNSTYFGNMDYLKHVRDLVYV